MGVLFVELRQQLTEMNDSSNFHCKLNEMLDFKSNLHRFIWVFEVYVHLFSIPFLFNSITKTQKNKALKNNFRFYFRTKSIRISFAYAKEKKTLSKMSNTNCCVLCDACAELNVHIQHGVDVLHMLCAC